MFGVHSLVKASDEGYGEYIGEVVGYRGSPIPVYYVKILACIEYPSQYALLVKHVRFKRDPYPYLSQQTFLVSDVQIYHGRVPAYKQSVETAEAAAYGQAGHLAEKGA